MLSAPELESCDSQTGTYVKPSMRYHNLFFTFIQTKTILTYSINNAFQNQEDTSPPLPPQLRDSPVYASNTKFHFYYNFRPKLILPNSQIQICNSYACLCVEQHTAQIYLIITIYFRSNLESAAALTVISPR